MIQNTYKFEVKDNILKSALFGSYTCNENKVKVNGYFNHDEYFLSRSLLTYCAEKLFNVHRLPGYEESYRGIDTYLRRKAFKDINTYDLQKMYDEFERLYEHTQNYLQSYGNLNKGKILLYRHLCPYEREQVYKQLKRSSSEICYYSNIYSSYTEDINLYSHLPVLQKRYVNVEDIFIFYKCLMYPRDCCKYYKEDDDDIVKEKEALVLNRDPFGRITLPIDNYEWREDLQRDVVTYDEYFYNSVSGERYANIDGIEIKKKPCESGIVRLMINFQKLKNKDE